MAVSRVADPSNCVGTGFQLLPPVRAHHRVSTLQPGARLRLALGWAYQLPLPVQSTQLRPYYLEHTVHRLFQDRRWNHRTRHLRPALKRGAECNGEAQLPDDRLHAAFPLVGHSCRRPDRHSRSRRPCQHRTRAHWRRAGLLPRRAVDLPVDNDRLGDLEGVRLRNGYLPCGTNQH